MELFQAIDHMYENHLEKYEMMDDFLNNYKDFNPNGESDLYSTMWAIQTIIDTTYPDYSNINVTIYDWSSIISTQDYLILRLINEFKAFINYPLLKRLLNERNSYVLNKDVNISRRLIESNEMIESLDTSFKSKRKCMSYD